MDLPGPVHTGLHVNEILGFITRELVVPKAKAVPLRWRAVAKALKTLYWMHYGCPDPTVAFARVIAGMF